MKRILTIGVLTVSALGLANAGPTKEPERLVKDGRLREAEALMAKALTASPKSIDLLTLSARISARLKEKKKLFSTLATLIPLLKSKPTKTPAPSAAARKAFDAGFAEWRIERYDTALPHFEAAIKDSPRFARAHFFAAYCACNMERLERCTDGLLRAIKEDPASPDRYEVVGILKFQLDDWRGVLDAIDAAEKHGSKMARIRTMRALAATYLSGRPEDGLRHADEAIRVDAKDPFGYQVKGALLLALKRFDEAQAALVRALELFPDLVRALNLLGRLHAMKSDFARAETFFRQATRVAPDDYETYFYLSRALFEQKKSDEAIAAFRDGVRTRHRIHTTSRAHLQREWPKGVENFLATGAGLWVGKFAGVARENGFDVHPVIAAREAVVAAIKAGVLVAAVRVDFYAREIAMRSSLVVGHDPIRESFLTLENDPQAVSEFDRAQMSDWFLYVVAPKGDPRPSIFDDAAYAAGRLLDNAAGLFWKNDWTGMQTRLAEMPGKGLGVPAALLLAMNANARAQKLDEALRVATRLVETSRGGLGEMARVARMDALIELKRRDEAVAGAKSVLERAPRHGIRAEDLNRAGLLLKRTTLHHLAIQAFEKARDMDRTNEMYPTNAGVAYRDIGQVQKAIESFKRALAIAPKRADIRTELASLYMTEVGDDEEALRELEDAVTADTRHARAHYLLGISHTRAYRLDAAAEAWRRLLKLTPSAETQSLFYEGKRMLTATERLIAARADVDVSKGAIARVNHESIPESEIAETAPTQVRAALEARIRSRLRSQEVFRWAVEVGEAELDDAVNHVRVRNKATPAEFLKLLDSEGLTMRAYRERLRAEILETRLRRYMGPRFRSIDDYIDVVRARAWVVIDSARLAEIEGGKAIEVPPDKPGAR
ncbi:MAG: tetratricopeptide repeat protein [Deltaproteobacteria bacterium]|nr:tetratricopeptide repeat protein [Deltaproteobacteria bacterium]